MASSNPSLTSEVPRLPTPNPRLHNGGSNVRIEVWAPSASHVALHTTHEILPMAPVEGGSWRAKKELRVDTDYWIQVDGLDIPDPRCLRMPRGVHGPSRVFDPRSFSWVDSRWSPPAFSSAVIYELHVGTFSQEGTFRGAIAKLDHLLELGVTHVELMPVASFPGERGWGYDGVGLYAVHEPYGGPLGLQEFVDACHARGLAVILDVVYNHLGPDGNYLERLGPYFSEAYKTPWGKAVNFDQSGADDVRKFFCDNAETWVRDFHIDGLRLDAVHAFMDRSALHFLEEIAIRMRQLENELGRPIILIAESDLNDPRIVRSSREGGYGVGAQWNDDFHHALHVALTGESHSYYRDFRGASDLVHAFETAFVLDGRYNRFRGRRHGRSSAGLSAKSFVVYSQDHDQVGNRPRGERLCHLISEGRTKIAAALTIFSPSIPMLFQGEEWAASSPFYYFIDHQDPALVEAIRRGRAREAEQVGVGDAPDPQSRSTFERSKLDWSELQGEKGRSMLAWYRDLLALRRRHRAFTKGFENVRARLDPSGAISIQRDELRLIANTTGNAIRLEMPGDFHISLTSDHSVELDAGRLLMPSDTVCILEAAS